MSDRETVNVRVTREVLGELFTRDAAGHRLRVDWGEPDAEGFYEPTITSDYADIARGELDAAWAEVEAELPEGWWIVGIERQPRAAGGHWIVTTQPIIDASLMGFPSPQVRALGDTPAAALRALAAKLRA